MNIISRNRKSRLHEETRKNILNAAMQIVKADGWELLSMRKIGECIEYTAPVIYQYFKNKEAILIEMTGLGFRRLAEQMAKAGEAYTDPSQQIEAIWLSYWKFAIQDKEIYQLMFGLGTHCCNNLVAVPEAEALWAEIKKVVTHLIPFSKPQDTIICEKFYTYWAMVHGLVSITLIDDSNSLAMNESILITVLRGVTTSILTDNSAVAPSLN